MTKFSPQRNRWVTKVGDTELTYIGRDIDDVYHVEALVLRNGTSKIAYQFRVPESAVNDMLAYAGRPPEEVIWCEFSVTKVKPTDTVAKLVSATGKLIEIVDLSTEWYAEL